MRRARGGDFRPLEEIAAAAGALLDHPEQGMHLRAIAAWRRAVGERIHRATRVTGMRGGTLTVDVPDRAWSDSLRGLEGTILSRIREGLGGDGPRRLELRVARGVWRPTGRPARKRADALTQKPATSGGGVRREEVPSPAAVPEPHPAAPGNALLESEIPVRDADLRRALCRVANRLLARKTSPASRP